MMLRRLHILACAKAGSCALGPFSVGYTISISGHLRALTEFLRTTTVGVESQDDSVEAMSGARKATGMLGGTPEVVPNLGEEAFFGAMSILYVRKGNFMITITPPNLQLVAASAAYSKVTDAKMGSVEQAKAMQDLVAVEKTDPLNAGLKGGNDVQGALAVVAASSKKQGTTNEAQARAMGLALAAKILSKI
jgi:hypothetical protein